MPPDLDEVFREHRSRGAQARWLRQYHDRASRVILNLQTGRAANAILRDIQGSLESGEPPSRAMRDFVNALHNRIEDAMAPNTTHPPMTGTHSHLHAGYEMGDAGEDDALPAQDGNHRHTHTHRNDNDHDHADQHDAQAADDDAATVNGAYGAEMTARWPSERAAARRARQGGLR